jgi:hypothetical protein
MVLGVGRGMGGMRVMGFDVAEVNGLIRLIHGKGGRVREKGGNHGRGVLVYNVVEGVTGHKGGGVG